MKNTRAGADPMPTIGVGGILFNAANQVLLIQRNQPPASGFWSVPGGKQESGESLAESCQREIFEETGLEAEAKSIIAVVERRLEGFHYVIVDFLAVLKHEPSCPPIAQTDVADAQWVNVEAIQHFALVEGLAEIIRRAYTLHINQRFGGLLNLIANGQDYILSIEDAAGQF
jgi:ADP-ribose pyrophosphatase YjhB (NUDIX family)